MSDSAIPPYPTLPENERPSPVQVFRAALLNAWAQAPSELSDDEADRLLSVLRDYGYAVVLERGHAVWDN